MTDKTTQPRLKSVGYDDLIEDIFGLNMRGLKSIWILFKNPKAYYDAAWDADWSGKFTPSFRLWFSLLALTFFFQFIWASGDSALLSNYEIQLQSAIDSGQLLLPDGVETRDAAVILSRWYFGLLPFGNALFFAIMGAAFVFWGRKIPLVIRFRYAFISVTLPALATLVIYLIVPLLPKNNVVPFVLSIGSATLLLGPITVFRGAFGDMKMGGRLWRTAVFTVFLV